MKTVTTIQENAEDIYEEAKQINEDRAAEEDIYEEFEDEDPIEDEAEEPQDEEAKPE
jgi:hypothetical protein